MDSFVTPMDKCCECGYEADRATSVVGGPKPEPGDASLCIKCTSLNIFGDDLSLRAPTEDEVLAAAADPLIQKARRAVLAMQKQHAKLERDKPSPEEEAEIDRRVARLDYYTEIIDFAIRGAMPVHPPGAEGDIATTTLEPEVVIALAMISARYVALLERCPDEEDAASGFRRLYHENLRESRERAAQMFPNGPR